MTSTFEWALDNIRIEKDIRIENIISTKFGLQNNKNPNFGPIWGPRIFFHGFYLY